MKKKFIDNIKDYFTTSSDRMFSEPRPIKRGEFILAVIISPIAIPMVAIIWFFWRIFSPICAYLNKPFGGF